MKNRFEGCFQKYQDLLMFIVWERTSDYELAQDIRQQVFFAFLVHMEEVSPEEEKAWLVRCTKNAVIDHLREKERWGESFLGDENGDWMMADFLEEFSIESLELKLVMKQAVDRLLCTAKEVNIHWYEALKLYFLEEYTYAETAERLNVSEQLVRSWVSRAKAYIKAKLWNEYLIWIE
ncbi:MAG: sigma-70 family RNA polymerase sigma factor [Lachnospiraceae bacterium]|nr:sigma-70 family RNA polymerase sigma factor [Lachnospiraceae bacterium]